MKSSQTLSARVISQDKGFTIKKIFKFKLAAILTAIVASFLVTLTAHAQVNGTWTALTSGDASGNWSATANWLSGNVASGAGSTANFSTLDVTANSVVNLDMAPTVGNLVFGDSVPADLQGTNTWVVSGLNTLTLSTSSGTPTITVNWTASDNYNYNTYSPIYQNSTAAIQSVIAGTRGLIKGGSGTLRLNGANTYTNNYVGGFAWGSNTWGGVSTIITNGILQVGNAQALGSIPANAQYLSGIPEVIVTNSGTLEIISQQQPAYYHFMVSGVGNSGTNGAIYANLSNLGFNNSNTRLSIGFNSATNPAIVLAGDTTIKVDQPAEAATNFWMNFTTCMLVGNVSESTPCTLTKTGNGNLQLNNASGYNAGNIHVMGGIFSVGQNTTIMGSQTITVDSGTYLYLRNGTGTSYPPTTGGALDSPNISLVLNGRLDLNGRPSPPYSGTVDANSFRQEIGTLNDDGSGSGVITNGTLGNVGTNWLWIDSANSNSTFSGTIVKSGTGMVAVQKDGTNSTLRLTGNNTYEGPTVVNEGSLLVNGSHTGGGAYTVGFTANSGIKGVATLGGYGTISTLSTITIISNGIVSAGDPAGLGGTFTVGSILDGGLDLSSVSVSNASLNCLGIGTLSDPVRSLTLSGRTLTVPLPATGDTAADASVFVTNLIVNGASTINFTSAYPLLGQFTLIKYNTLTTNGVTCAGLLNGLLTLGTLPADVTAAFLTNNVANKSIAINVTGVISTTPAVPTGLTATGGDAQVALGWNAVPGAESYNVKSSTTNGGPYVTVITNVTGLAFTSTGLANGTTYYFVVSAVNSLGESADSTQVRATPPGVPAPLGLTATAVNWLVVLNWTASSGATSYNVERATTSGGPYTIIATGVTVTSFTDATAANNTTNYYVVTAVNTQGEGSANSSQVSATPTTFVHPGCLSQLVDLNRMATNVAAGNHPWIDSWNILTNNSHAQTNYTPNPQGTVTRTSTGGNYTIAMYDIAAAYQCALRYYGSGNTNYANKAVSILNAWSLTLTNLGGDSNMYLAAGIYGYEFACAAELMRNYSGWQPADFARYQTMMLTVWYPVNHNFLVNHNGACISHYWANWDLCNMTSMLAIGVLCDDQAVFNEAINYFHTGLGNGSIGNAVYYVHPGDLGQLQEEGRDQGHADLDIALLGPFCEIAWNQGLDLYGYAGNRFLAATEYWAKYNLTNSVPYVTYITCDPVIQTNISSASQGDIRPIWAMVYNHYHNRRGLAATYTGQYAAKVQPEGGGGNYGPNSGGYDQLGYGTLTHTIASWGAIPPAVPAAPTALIAAYPGGQVNLFWAASPGATNYNVMRSTVNGGPYTNLVSLNVTSTNYTDTSVVSGTTYYYVVSACNAGGESGQSAQASVVTSSPTVPQAPAGLTATPADAQVTLAWNVVTNASGYYVKRSTTSGGSYTVVGAKLAGLSYMNTGLANGTVYFFVVSATNSAGASANSAEVSARPVSLTPPQINSGINGNQLQFSWPVANTSWRLEAQTNSLSTGLGTNWVTVSGSDSTNQMTISIGSTNGSVFFRLVYP
jgi:autotransporter-associated beta strand protein